MTLLIVFMLPFALVGLVVFYWVFMPSKKPADESNRINRLTALWITLKHPEIYAHAYKFFTQDVMDNVRDVEKTK